MRVVLNTNKFNTYQNKQDKNVTFRGFNDKLTDKMAQGFANLAKKPNTVKFVDWIAKKDVVATLAATTGLAISGLYIFNTAKSKKIEEEQKKPLMINMGLVAIASTVLGHFIDKSVKKKMDNLENYFVEKNTGRMAPEKLNICKKGIKPAATLLIFTSIYRYISPVLVTPVANKISNALTKKEN